MTKEECLKVLQALWRSKDCGYSDYEIRESLNMAIEALEQAPDIEKVIDTINFEEKWLLDAGYSCSNVNTAFRSIKHDLRKLGRSK